MAVSKPIHFEHLSSITNNNKVLFNFCVKTMRCLTLILFAHIVAMDDYTLPKICFVGRHYLVLQQHQPLFKSVGVSARIYA